jgi:hypothetical protein
MIGLPPARANDPAGSLLLQLPNHELCSVAIAMLANKGQLVVWQFKHKTVANQTLQLLAPFSAI